MSSSPKSALEQQAPVPPAKKFPAGLIGFFAGATAFAGTLYFAPSVVQAATYAIAGAVASVLGASVGVYLAALVAVGVAAGFAGALIGLALRSLFEMASSKPRSEADSQSSSPVATA